jgi:hypothetical protein
MSLGARTSILGSATRALLLLLLLLVILFRSAGRCLPLVSSP